MPLNLDNDQLKLLRQALSEAIESVKSVIDGNLQLDKSLDTPGERRFRKMWNARINEWIKLRKVLGGVRPGEQTTTDDFCYRTIAGGDVAAQPLKRRRRVTVRRAALSQPILATLPLTLSASGASVELSEKNLELLKKKLSRGRA